MDSFFEMDSFLVDWFFVSVMFVANGLYGRVTRTSEWIFFVSVMFVANGLYGRVTRTSEWIFFLFFV